MKIAVSSMVKGVFVFGNRSVAKELTDGYKYFYNSQFYYPQYSQEIDSLIKAIKRIE